MQELDLWDPIIWLNIMWSINQCQLFLMVVDYTCMMILFSLLLINWLSFRWGNNSHTNIIRYNVVSYNFIFCLFVLFCFWKDKRFGTFIQIFSQHHTQIAGGLPTVSILWVSLLLFFSFPSSLLPSFSFFYLPFSLLFSYCLTLGWLLPPFDSTIQHSLQLLELFTLYSWFSR